MFQKPTSPKLSHFTDGFSSLEQFLVEEFLNKRDDDKDVTIMKRVARRIREKFSIGYNHRSADTYFKRHRFHIEQRIHEKQQAICCPSCGRTLAEV